jgi:GlpG protein
MRQVGILPHERDARRFLAFLITQDIEATCEREGESWVVWIHDEDHLNQARNLLKDYQQNPDDPRYQDATRVATQKLQEANSKREAASKNVVEVGNRWRAGGGVVGRNAPLVIVLIVISLLVAAFTQLGNMPDTSTFRALSFVELSPELLAKEKVDRSDIPLPFHDILRGQVWRLVTPIFLHFGAMHIIFNCLAMFMLGSQVEERRGSYFFITLILVSAVISNCLQAAAEPISAGMFGGLSGVLYAVFGYMWIVVLNGNRERYDLSPTNIAILLGWLILCILREIPTTANMVSVIVPEHVANVAHVAGLFVGMAFAGVARKK